MTPSEHLRKMLDRPWYLPRPTQAEIVGAALAKLHSDLTALISRTTGDAP